MQKPPSNEKQLEQMRADIKMSPSALPIEELYPVIVPRGFVETGAWPGPIVKLTGKGLAMTWVVLRPEQAMAYVSLETAGYWESSQIDWKARAMKNLISASRERLWTHEFRDDSARISFVAMMHEDGIGPSRVLLHDDLSKLFPTGYGVCTPEMSCAFVYSMSLSAADEKKLSGLIDNCYKDGTRPLSPLRYLPADFNRISA